MERKLGRVQLAVLEHLARVALDQLDEARRTHKRRVRGWTTIDFNRHVRSETISSLIMRDMVEVILRPYNHDGDLYRISRRGIIELENHLGVEIMA